MDEIYFEDPRNARWFPTRSQIAPTPTRPPIRLPLAATPPTYAQPTYAQPMMVQPQPVAMVQPAATPSRLRTRLGDLTVGDIVPLVAQLIVAFRPMPVPPTDARNTDTNLVNLTKFVEANAAHFHGDAQLNAAGTILGKLFG